MAKAKTNRELQSSASAIRRALPGENKIAISMCEAGLGLSWEQLPERLKKGLRRSARTSLYVLSALMAQEPELLRQANEARFKQGGERESPVSE